MLKKPRDLISSALSLPGIFEWARDLMNTLKDNFNALDQLPINDAGAVMLYPPASLPAGWLRTDGSLVNTADYPELGVALGAVGATFNLPNITVGGVVGIIKTK